MKSKNAGILIAIVGALAVVLGAFGAHSLKGLLSVERLQTYSTGITYHFYHLFGMCAAYIISMKGESIGSKRAFYSFMIGIFLFSGSIYLLACRDLLGIENYRWLGPITPIGGLFFIAGWIFLGISIYRTK